MKAKKKPVKHKAHKATLKIGTKAKTAYEAYKAKFYKDGKPVNAVVAAVAVPVAEPPSTLESDDSVFGELLKANAEKMKPKRYNDVKHLAEMKLNHWRRDAGLTRILKEGDLIGRRGFKPWELCVGELEDCEYDTWNELNDSGFIKIACYKGHTFQAVVNEVRRYCQLDYTAADLLYVWIECGPKIIPRNKWYSEPLPLP